MGLNVLLVEDDEKAAALVVKGLQDAGHQVVHCADGESGLEAARQKLCDVLVIDRMLPKKDGLSVIQALREDGNDTPILILSALGQLDDRLTGLKGGSDDYLTKPFAFTELLARIEVLGRRRNANSTQTRLTLGELTLDLITRQAWRQGIELELKPREFALLEFFMRHPQQLVTRNMLLEKVWNINFDPQTNVIDVHVSRLRQKLDKDFDVMLLHTMRGNGYMLKIDHEAE
ncbi:MAG: response regulator transcription factor [Alphaproteobacteria bacterium]